MNILIVNCHWNNRGDEAAIRAMIDELLDRYPEAVIYVQKANGLFESFPETENVRVLKSSFPSHTRKRRKIDFVAYTTNGRICLTNQQKTFFEVLRKTDIVLHAPGGPSIGDTYLKQEEMKLKRLDLIRKSNIPYIFYAPSMGPFENKERNTLRKSVLEGAALICLREAESYKYVKKFLPDLNPVVTLDSAFQHPIDISDNEKKYNEYVELKQFLDDGDNVIGITVTDLQWHSRYFNDGHTAHNIRNSFTEFITWLTKAGYKVLFIPQLFDPANDYDYMCSFMQDNCFVMDDKHDCYFQQFIISKLMAVVGMRYHSNIFSAKMGTPFISISYEQKMVGFMERAGLTHYCIDINDLSAENLQSKFNYMIEEYTHFKAYLQKEKETFRLEATKTTDYVCDYIDKNISGMNQREKTNSSVENVTLNLQSIKKHVKRNIKVIKNHFTTSREFRQDRINYNKWQYSRPGLKSKSALEGKILRQTHTIEKGMSLENPRDRFGVQKTIELLDYINEYQRCGYPIEDSSAVCNSIGVIKGYLDYHKKRGFIPEEIERRFQVLSKYVPDSEEPFGIKQATREEIEAAAHGEFPVFIASRHSVRQFQHVPVEIEDIRKAVALAMHAPSACNRQSCHIYYYSDKIINEALAELIAGNTGFESDVPNYLVITSDMSCFHEAFERNQAYIDGGIMTMCLIEALHYFGIASCVLQNGEYDKKNKSFRNICGNIPENEIIICFIAIGYYKEKFAFATSHRKDLSDVLIEA